MDTSLVSALAAVLGSLVGGSATMMTAWITQRTSTKRELISEELRKREALYGEFISECSRLAIDSLAHGIEGPEKMWTAYASLNRIRLSASEAVLVEAEAVLKRIADQYFSPNVSLDEFRTIALSQQGDPIESFGRACRTELEAIRAARQLIEGEVLDVIRTVHGVHVHDGEHRRNIVTRGLALRELEGTRLRIGDVLLEYDRRRRVKARTRELRYYVAARLLT